MFLDVHAVLIKGCGVRIVVLSEMWANSYRLEVTVAVAVRTSNFISLFMCMCVYVFSHMLSAPSISFFLVLLS
jgi:hypothetical protein